MAIFNSSRCVERRRDTFLRSNLPRLRAGPRALFAWLLVIAATPASAQSIAEEARALVVAKREAAVASQRSNRLEAEAARAINQATRARAQAAAVAARVQAAEADIAAAEARIRIVETLRAQQRARIAEKQQPIVRLAAALQTMARRPPILTLVQQGSIADLVHVRALLGATLPVIARRTAGLRAELRQGAVLRRRAELAVASLRAGQARLEVQQVALARLEAAQRQRSAALSNSAMLESERALALGEQARDIGELMQELGAQADVRSRLATLPGPLLRPPVPGRAPLPGLNAAVEGEGALPPYRLPVAGRVTAGLGEVSASGVRARGLSLATRADAQVVAPGAGRIAYAGQFRTYGRIVIIDHGGGWTTLVTGMTATNVAVGDTVDRGGPIGRAGKGRPTITVELRHGGRPVDITALVGSG